MTLEELRELAQTERDRQKTFRHRINVCVAAGCLSQRSDQVKAGLETELQARGIEKSCQVKGVGCMGLCAAGPLVSVETQGRLYANVHPSGGDQDGDEEKDTAAIIASLDGPPVERLALPTDLPFFTRQQKIVLENCGQIDPERIEDYIAAGGYEALLNVLTEMTPAEVVEQVVKSGLRGRGGAGYPDRPEVEHGRQGPPRGTEVRHLQRRRRRSRARSWTAACWKAIRTACWKAWPSRPTRWAPTRAYIYVRAEYPLAIKRLQDGHQAGRAAWACWAAASSTSPFNFNVDLRLGAGAFVCGEETALMASVEGKRGTPRPRPPFPAESGLWGCPTLINNVETFANVPPIIRNGGEWFAEHRHGEEQGHQGVRAGRQDQQHRPDRSADGHDAARDHLRTWAAAFPMAASSRRCRPAVPPAAASRPQHLDTPVDYESLAKLGSIMGSGGMIVMDETLLHGGCGPVLHGVLHGRILRQVHSLPRRHGADARPAGQDHATAKPRRDDLALLEELCDMVKSTSLCGLGQTAPNPVLQHAAVLPRGIRRAHARTDRCPAGVCEPWQRPKGGATHELRNRQPCMIKTLTIDGTRSQRPRGSDASSRWRARTASSSRRSATWKGLSDVGACRLCLVEVKGSNKLLPACVTTVQEGMEVTDRLASGWQVPPDDPGAALRRAQSRLRGLRLQRPLRTADAGAEAGRWTTCACPTCYPALAGGRLPRPVRGGPQPLHPVHALRAGVRRDRRRAHLGRHAAAASSAASSPT